MVAQFVNIEVGDRSALGSGGLARHKRTVTRDQHTTEGPRAGTPAVHLVDEVEGTREALAFLEEDRRRRAGKRGRPPSGVYNALFTGPARYDGLNGPPLTLEQELAWAEQCLAWLRERAPDAIIAAAILHRDEASPHLHVTLIPRYQPPEKGKELEPARLDWRAVRAQLAGRPVRPKIKTAGLSKTDIRKVRAKDKKEAQADMVALLDSVHDQVMAPYGIARAQTGEGKRRVAVDRRIAAELEAQAAEAAAERSCARQLKADTAAAEAVERRSTAENAQSVAETAARTAKEQADLEAEASRRAELALQEEARVRLQRIEDKIAVAGAGKFGKRARRGQAILEERNEALALVQTQLETKTAELADATGKVEALKTVAVDLETVTVECDRLKKENRGHQRELVNARAKYYALGWADAVKALRDAVRDGCAGFSAGIRRSASGLARWLEEVPESRRRTGALPAFPSEEDPEEVDQVQWERGRRQGGMAE